MALMAALLLGLLLPAGAEAHRIMMEEKRAGELWVYYEGRLPAAEVPLTIMDERGEVVLRGETDAEGRFYFSPHPAAVVARADDGMGHRVVFDLEKSAMEGAFIGEQLPQPLRIVLGLGIIFLLAGALYLWGKSSREK
ncbi:hypothetical protein [Desulfurivibrio alkaliphilus]|nr:hypothetical protein [Desulfurivibrio alkaliphilus]